MYDKKVVCDKYLNRGIPLVRLDGKFIFFTQIINDLENVKPYFDIKSIRINLRPLIHAIIEHAVEWRNTLGNMLSDRTSVEMVSMHGEFKVKSLCNPRACHLADEWEAFSLARTLSHLSERGLVVAAGAKLCNTFQPLRHSQNLRLNMDRNIKQLSDFKAVMNTINAIQSTTLSVELKIKDMQETYNVLEEHRIQVSIVEMLSRLHFILLRRKWNEEKWWRCIQLKAFVLRSGSESVQRRSRIHL